MLRDKPDFVSNGINSLAERVAYIYYAFGAESKTAHFAEHVYTESIAYFEEALRRTSLPAMRHWYQMNLNSSLRLQQSAENDKIAAEARAVLEAQQKAAFEAQQKTSHPE